MNKAERFILEAVKGYDPKIYDVRFIAVDKFFEKFKDAKHLPPEYQAAVDKFFPLPE